MTAKAFNGRILSEWFQRCLSDAANSPNQFRDPNEQLPLLAQCMSLVLAGRDQKRELRTSLNTWYSLQERYGRFMDSEERARYVDSLLRFIRLYVGLARQAVRLGPYTSLKCWSGLERMSSGSNRRSMCLASTLDLSLRSEMMIHVARAAQQWGRNARHHHCFSDEDGMSWLKRALAALRYALIDLRNCILGTSGVSFSLPLEAHEGSITGNAGTGAEEPWHFADVFWMFLPRMNRSAKMRVQKHFMR